MNNNPPSLTNLLDQEHREAHGARDYKSIDRSITGANMKNETKVKIWFWLMTIGLIGIAIWALGSLIIALLQWQ